MQAALEAAQRMGDAESPSDIIQEYQNWFRREMKLLAEDGKAYQQQVLSAGAHVRAQAEEEQPANPLSHHPATAADRAIAEMMASVWVTLSGSQHTGLLKEVKLN
jgi:hypothetical protein